MKTIARKLSTQGINSIINALENAERDIRWGAGETVAILTENGSGVAQASDGGMATVTGDMVGDMTGVIEVRGKAAIIAEFGAGDTTIAAPLFQNPAPVPVYPGSYSELVGSGEYYRTGRWHFGGKVYHAIPARLGLYHAKEYVENMYFIIAQGAIQL